MNFEVIRNVSASFTFSFLVITCCLSQVVTPLPSSEPSPTPIPENATISSPNELVDPLTTTKPTKVSDVKPAKTRNDPSIIIEMVPTNSTGNSDSSNATSSNYVIEYKPLVFDNPEDIKTQQEWGGNCTAADWDKCKKTAKWFGKYISPNNNTLMEHILDCRDEPVEIICLKNSWTVTRCNLLCMSRCNREIQYKYDKYVSHGGECQAHAHG